MAKHSLPPMTPGDGPLFGRRVKSWTVGSSPTALAPAYVALMAELLNGDTLVCKIESPQKVDELVQSLLRHKRDVWPEAP